MDAQQGQDTPHAIISGVGTRAIVGVQCLRCLEQGRQNEIVVQVENSDLAAEDNIDQYVAECQFCTKDLGVPALIPFTILVGPTAEQIFEDDDGEGDEVSEAAASALRGELPVEPGAGE